MSAEQKTCVMPGCDEPVFSTHANAVYCSPLCRNRYSRLLRNGEIALECPRCGHRDWVINLAGDDGCLACGYAAGDTLSLDGIRIVDAKYARSA